MDRNVLLVNGGGRLSVALRKESVDRNCVCIIELIERRVALRKESVDRNKGYVGSNVPNFTSLSARRAWIEICCACCSWWLLAVALRKESVDRNPPSMHCNWLIAPSLSARRAWIEIKCQCLPEYTQTGRSPQGERG